MLFLFNCEVAGFGRPPLGPVNNPYIRIGSITDGQMVRHLRAHAIALGVNIAGNRQGRSSGRGRSRSCEGTRGGGSSYGREGVRGDCRGRKRVQGGGCGLGREVVQCDGRGHGCDGVQDGGRGREDVRDSGCDCEGMRGRG